MNFTVTTVAPGSGTPTGNATVSDGVGDTCTGTVASGGCSLVFATAGAKIVKATYAGGPNFNSSTSAGVTHSVRDFSISSSPTSQTIKAGQKAMYKLTLAPLNGFTGSLTLSCTGSPAGSTCSFSAGTVSLTGSSSANSTVTVQTSKTTTKGTYSLTLTGAVWQWHTNNRRVDAECQGEPGDSVERSVGMDATCQSFAMGIRV